MNELFWNNVKDLLKEKGINQTELAVQIGVGVRTFQDWVYRKAVPDLEKIKKIADILGVTVDYLITGKTQELSTEENKLLNLYRGVPDLCKPIILNIAEQLAELKDKIN